METCIALKQIGTKPNTVRKNKMKVILLIAVMAFSINAFSQTETDFKPNELYGMLGMHPDYCIEKLKEKGYEYAQSDGAAHLYNMNGNAIVLNYDQGAHAVNTIVYATLDYAFVSHLRVFLQVGFYTADNVGDTQVWANAKGTSKIFLSQTKNEDDEDQYNVAFRNVED